MSRAPRSRDVERLLRGAAMVMQEAYRTEVPAASAHLSALSVHAGELRTRLCDLTPSMGLAVLRELGGAAARAAAEAARVAAGQGQGGAGAGAGDAEDVNVVDLSFTPTSDSSSSSSSSSSFAAATSVAWPTTILTSVVPKTDLKTVSMAPMAAPLPLVVLKPAALASIVSPSPSPSPSPFASPVLVLPPAEAAAISAHHQGQEQQRRRAFREVAVPASPLARVFGFGSLAARLAVGAAGTAMKNAWSGGGGAVPLPLPLAARPGRGLSAS